MYQNADVKPIGYRSKRDGMTAEYFLRDLKMLEIFKVHKLYLSLSDSSRNAYHSKIFGYPNSLLWFPAQIIMLISQSPLRKMLLRMHFRYVYFFKGVFNAESNLLGSAHIVTQGYFQNKLVARLGIFIRDDCQGHGMGTLLLKELINEAKKNKIDVIRLDVLSSNEKGLALYKKNGFVICENKEETQISGGNNSRTIYFMELPIN
jgi:GNAT superfamily N-acetyltransferase